MKLHSKIIGTGTPLLILHGFLGMGDNWKTLGNKFSKEGFEVHLIDQRNHGRSPHSDEFSYEIMAHDVVEYCKMKQLQKVVLMGHSMGGKTAMFVAAENPELVEKLIVVDIAPKYYAPHHQKILEGLSFLNSKKLESRETADEQLSEFVPELGVRQFLLKNLYWKEKDELALRLNLEGLIKNIETVGAPLPEGKTFAGKTLFIKGENSNYIKESDNSQIEKHFPNSEVEVIENSGHWVHAENSTDFYEAFMRFAKP